MSEIAPLPRLDQRHAAMLAEMGVNVWWQEASLQPPPAAKPAAAAVRGAVGTGPVGSRVLRPPSGQEPVPAQQMPARLAANPPRTVSPGADQAQVSPAMAAVHPPAAQRPAAPAAAPALVSAPAPRARARAVIPLAEVPADQAALADAIRACSACDLGARRHHAVPGMGDPAPDWLIVGEAPGEEEDRQGLPFVGRAGQLLDRMLAAMGLDRQHKVHIANVIKCRPPHNRNPDPVEIAQCEPWLLRQVELLQPRIIVALGRFAAHTLLAHSPAFASPEALRQLPLGKLRGRVHEVEIAGRRLPLVVSYHPAYLLRSPGEKAKSWADLCLAMDAFGQLPPCG
jgi:uracil-DNA glycosylase